MSINRRKVVAAAAATAMVTVPLGASGAAAQGPGPPDGHGPDRPHYTLTILHNNDGESQLINAPEQPDFGGVARFSTLVDDLRKDATTGKPGPGQAGRRGAVLVSSGDNFLAGPEFQASLDKGVPFYDSIALSRIGYDAIAIGNHEFDFGPDVLADFIEGFGGNTPFLSANLDVSNEPRLAALADDGTVVSSTVVRKRGAQIGIVGATTPQLPAISSPRDVEVLEDVQGIVQDQVDDLTSSGVNKIILISHLQNINDDIDLVPMLRDVDVAIAGGGTELLANEGDLLVPGDEPEDGDPLPYPIVAEDAEGDDVPVVTTAGAYKYVGRLVVNFDKDGEVLSTADSSGPVRVSGVAPDAVEPDAGIQQDVVDPVNEAVADRAGNVIAQSEVDLEGREDPGVRTQETNLGNLVADALRDAGTDNAADFGVTEPDVAIQNGGGIRGDTLIQAGEFTELDTFNIAPFSNFVSVVPDIPRGQFKEIVENLVSQMPDADGRFGQISGFSFEYDATLTAQVVDNDGVVQTEGERVRSLTLGDGTVIVEDGSVVDGPPVAIATNDFSARGGDQYPFRGAPFTTVGVTYQQALADYIVEDLAGVISDDDYPEGGEGRIVQLD